jgi:pyridoxal phosphate enzyme (YggS family)
MESAVDRLKRVLERMSAASRRSGRDPKAITLVVVTKTVPYEKVAPYLKAGVQDIGENRVQEALEKYARMREARFHLIGPLQTNKAKKAVEFFDVIQSLDRLELAQDLDRHARGAGKVQDCLVQIKISEEMTKSGLDPTALTDFLGKLREFSGLRIRGLMGIPPLEAQDDKARPYFQRLRRLFEDVSSIPRSTFNILSMGMSADFEAAIAEGSTMVRIGTALFGPRT